MSDRTSALLPLIPKRQERRRYTNAVSIAFGSTLQRARVTTGLTRKALVLKAGMDCSYISQLQRGRRQTTIFKILALSEAMKIQPDALIVETCAHFNASASTPTCRRDLLRTSHGRG